MTEEVLGIPSRSFISFSSDIIIIFLCQLADKLNLKDSQEIACV
jgi:hypothetical protein